MPYLNPNQLDDLSDSIYLNIGYQPSQRTVFLSSVNRQFRALLPADPIDKIQLDLDLFRLNNTPRLTDGTIPFEAWLERVSRYVKVFPDANKIVQEALAAVNNESAPALIGGVPAPTVATLEKIQREKIIFKNDMVSFAFLEAGTKAGNSVVKVKVARYDNGVPKMLNGNAIIHLGTGWMLTKELIITNHHVINARNNNEPNASSADFNSQAANTIIEFDCNSDNVQGHAMRVVQLEAQNSDLDYTILRLSALTDRVPLPLLPGKIDLVPEETQVVNIIQHPFGLSKKIALRNNNIYNAPYPYVRYFTDTEGGSSGSPVFNDNWQVIALHRASVLMSNVQYNGQTTAWVNEGVQLHAIADDLRKNFKAISDEIGL